MFQGRAFGFLWSQGRHKEVAQPLLPVPDMTFSFQHPKGGPYGRITWRIGQIVQDLSYRGKTALEENIHDLAFPPTEIQMSSLIRHSGTCEAYDWDNMLKN
jgi:hypothetical protein